MRRHADGRIDSTVPEGISDSLRRRLAFACETCFFFDRLGGYEPFSRFAVLGYWPVLRIPAHAARVGFDLLECLRTASRVPEIGDVESALLDTPLFVPQHPRYLSYWYDASIHSMVGMHVGIDLIHHGGRYYVIENNLGPSIYPRRRRLYRSEFDPIVLGITSTACELGFKTIVPIAYRWGELYVDEFRRVGGEYGGISVVPTNCPFGQPGGATWMTALPQPLAPGTMYVIHSGLTTAVIRYVDNKWYAHGWLERAIKNELPSDSLIAVPQTRDELSLPGEDHGARWPNLVIKLADSARSSHVIAARFDDEREAREALGLNGTMPVPRGLRLGFAKSLLFGQDRVIYQEFIPPQLDSHGHAQMIRLHLLVSPLRTVFLSAHLRVSQQPVPARVPRGIIGQDNAFIFNRADYEPVSPEMECELRHVAEHLGRAMQSAIARKFETGHCGKQA